MTNSDYYRARIQNALEFIEQHLSSNFTVTDVARAAHFSEYHFHRLFPAFIGESIHQYVRTRRLEKAAIRLRENPGIRLLDLALDVGFETHSAFTRAFKQHFSMSPSQFRKSVWPSKTGHHPHFVTTATNSLTLEYSIQSLPQLFLAYKIAHGTSSGQFFVDQRPDQEFISLVQQSKRGFYGVVSAFPASPQSLNDPTAEVYYGGLFTNPKLSLWSKQNLLIPAGDWAVFHHKGAYDYLHQSWNQIYRAWLSNADYVVRDTLPFEIYLNNPQQTDATELLTQIWLPIK